MTEEQFKKAKELSQKIKSVQDDIDTLGENDHITYFDGRAWINPATLDGIRATFVQLVKSKLAELQAEFDSL